MAAAKAFRKRSSLSPLSTNLSQCDLALSIANQCPSGHCFLSIRMDAPRALLSFLIRLLHHPKKAVNLRLFLSS